MLSLREAVSDEAISVFGQRLLRSAGNDALTLCHAMGVLSHSPKPMTPYEDEDFTLAVIVTVGTDEETVLDQCLAASAAIEDDMEIYILPRVRVEQAST